MYFDTRSHVHLHVWFTTTGPKLVGTKWDLKLVSHLCKLPLLATWLEGLAAIVAAWYILTLNKSCKIYTCTRYT